MSIEIDIVLFEEGSDRTVAVLDTKYKTAEVPAEADIYQIAFYAHELQVDHAILVYPSTSLRSFRIRHGNQIELESLIFDIGAPLDSAGSTFVRALGSTSPRDSKTSVGVTPNAIFG